MNEHTDGGEKREKAKATHVYSKTFLRKTERALSLALKNKAAWGLQETGIVYVIPEIMGIINPVPVPGEGYKPTTSVLPGADFLSQCHRTDPGGEVMR
jgi:hypothetical protein